VILQAFIPGIKGRERGIGRGRVGARKCGEGHGPESKIQS